MQIKFIQINIYKGKFLDQLVGFLKEEQPDIISAQEVTSGKANFYKDKGANLFEVLKDKLRLNGVYHSDLVYRNWPEAKFGNAVFCKFPIKSSNIVVLNVFRPVTFEEVDGASSFRVRPKLPRHMVDAQVVAGDVRLHAISVHGAWTAPPSDTFETLRQAKIVADYLKDLREPYILGGDLNNVIGSKTVTLINKVAKNWMMGSRASQTTHPTYHKIAPRGFLVDYIFTSRDFKLLKLEVADVLVSDHLPVVAEFELEDNLGPRTS